LVGCVRHTCGLAAVAGLFWRWLERLKHSTDSHVHLSNRLCTDLGLEIVKFSTRPWQRMWGPMLAFPVVTTVFAILWMFTLLGRH
jgi:hypothetical protein